MRYRQGTSGGSDEKAFIPLDSQLSDKERFKDAKPFLIQCRSCKGELNFSPINDREVSVFCPNWFALLTIVVISFLLSSLPD
jgi:DNA polymerase alpha subunit A